MQESEDGNDGAPHIHAVGSANAPPFLYADLLPMRFCDLRVYGVGLMGSL